ncbi:hypothetical protein ACH5RR_039415 [Cinchona calisaya]|uniref:Uncharacterized protein n=1 Tax=Cinchona calisaya TaxID=153742 RepID=A0ABD2XY52_9GENT
MAKEEVCSITLRTGDFLGGVYESLSRDSWTNYMPMNSISSCMKKQVKGVAIIPNGKKRTFDKLKAERDDKDEIGLMTPLLEKVRGNFSMNLATGIEDCKIHSESMWEDRDDKKSMNVKEKVGQSYYVNEVDSNDQTRQMITLDEECVRGSEMCLLTMRMHLSLYGHGARQMETESRIMHTKQASKQDDVGCAGKVAGKMEVVDKESGDERYDLLQYLFGKDLDIRF